MPPPSGGGGIARATGLGTPVEAGTKLGRAGPSTAKDDAKADRERDAVVSACSLPRLLLRFALIGCVQLEVSLVMQPMEGSLPVGPALSREGWQRIRGLTGLWKHLTLDKEVRGRKKNLQHHMCNTDSLDQCLLSAGVNGCFLAVTCI